MRKLVEETVIKLWENGYNECPCGFDERTKQLGIPPHLIEDEEGWKRLPNPEFKISEVVKKISNEQLLELLDQQHCYMYR